MLTLALLLALPAAAVRTISAPEPVLARSVPTPALLQVIAALDLKGVLAGQVDLQAKPAQLGPVLRRLDIQAFSAADKAGKERLLAEAYFVAQQDVEAWARLRHERAEKALRDGFEAFEILGDADAARQADAALAALADEFKAVDAEMGGLYVSFDYFARDIERMRWRLKVGAAAAFGLPEPASARPPLPDVSAAELKTRMLEAVDGKFSGWSNWSVVAVGDYRLLGLSDAEIGARLAPSLDRFLAVGRVPGRSSRADLDSLRSLPPLDLAAPFEAKHGLGKVRALHADFGVDASKGYQSGSGLDYLLQIAGEVGDEDRWAEGAMRLVRLGRFEDLTKAAERRGDDALLLSAGSLALVDFLKNGHHNAVWYAIEALKRVRGALKPRAAELLHDLALALTSPQMLAWAGDSAKSFMEYAVKALRGTGRLVARRNEDSVKVDFLSVVEEPRFADALQALSIAALEKGSYEEAYKGLAAAGDVAKLREIVSGMLARAAAGERFYVNGGLRDGLRLAGMNDELKALGEAFLVYGEKHESSYGGAQEDAGEMFSAAGDAAGVARARAALEARQLGRRAIQGFEYSVNKAVEWLPADAKGWSPDSRQERDRCANELAEIRKTTTEAERKTYAQEGWELLAKGDAWNAHRAFLQALDRRGLIAAGDALLKANNGLNAWKPYLYASLL